MQRYKSTATVVQSSAALKGHFLIPTSSIFHSLSPAPWAPFPLFPSASLLHKSSFLAALPLPLSPISWLIIWPTVSHQHPGYTQLFFPLHLTSNLNLRCYLCLLQLCMWYLGSSACVRIGPTHGILAQLYLCCCPVIFLQALSQLLFILPSVTFDILLKSPLQPLPSLSLQMTLLSIACK